MVDINKIADKMNMTMTVKIKGERLYEIRMILSKIIFKLVARLLGANVSLEIIKNDIEKYDPS